MYFVCPVCLSIYLSVSLPAYPPWQPDHVDRVPAVNQDAVQYVTAGPGDQPPRRLAFLLLALRSNRTDGALRGRVPMRTSGGGTESA